MKLTIHGAIVSPWVRRLMLTCEEKGLAYDHINVNPLGEPDPEFLKISPLGKIPVLEVDGRFMPDSLAACAFLESAAPSPALFPSEGWDHGWMLWLCDYLGTGLFSRVEAPIFINRFVNPNFLGKESDEAAVDAAFELIPRYFGYLEEQLAHGKPYMLGDQLTLADLTSASVFVNFAHAGVAVDRAAYPRLADHVDRMFARASFKAIFERERAVFGKISPLFAQETA
jgi:glutathione S-transferase